MNKSRPSRLRFNFGFLLEAPIGTFREVELNYPSVEVVQDMTLVPLTGSFVATRISEGVYLSGTLHSNISAECVRCLEAATVALTLDIDELFYYPPHSAPEGAYVIGENGYMDLAPLVRELAWLGVPIQALCKPDCHGLCMECGQNLNHGECGCEVDGIDPRLSVLKQLLE
jgi:uncharacterized protein